MIKNGTEYLTFGHGKEIAIIELGIGCFWYDWHTVIDALKDTFTIYIFYRAGYGKSQVLNTPRTTKNIALELHTNIKNLGIEKPFLLIGHSFGGLCILQYAKMYPGTLKALLFIDSTSVSFHKLYQLNNPVMNQLIDIQNMVNANLKNSYKNKQELLESNLNYLKSCKAKYPKDIYNDLVEFVSSPTLYQTSANEFGAFEESANEIHACGSFPSIPYIVISRDSEISMKSFMCYDIPEEEAIQYEKVWRELQTELSQLTPLGKLVIATGCDHEIHLDNPQLIIDCIKSFC